MTRELNGDQTEFTDMRLKSLQAEFGIYCDRAVTPAEYCGEGGREVALSSTRFVVTNDDDGAE